MGSCCKSKPTQSISINHTYTRKAKVKIKHKNYLGDILRISTVKFSLTQPIQATSIKLKEFSNASWVSSCVIPGMDPRGDMIKQCQDLCFYKETPSSLLVCLFDGHGVQGQKLVHHCKKSAQKYFNNNLNQAKQDPTNFLTNLIQFCHQQVTHPNSKIDSINSGSTAILVYLIGNKLYSASVGDSRAIIATTNPPQVAPAPTARFDDQRHVLDTTKVRNSVLDFLLEAVQLTRDQKPDDPEELQRIITAGGRVQRLSDEMGNKIGPYRVWEMDVHRPGLAMSRSIGDMAGTEIGVISTPITTQYDLQQSDFFIVAASDGIWDVMENQEVVNFVEFYRMKCRRESKEPVQVKKVGFSNACIAQMLCEEARYRWFSIVADEDVLIDDISCVIVQLSSGQITGFSEYRRQLSRISHDPEEEICNLERSPSIKETQTRDPRRNSIASPTSLV